MVEEFRQPFVDRAVFSLLTKGRSWEKFKLDPEKKLLDKETRDTVIKAVLNRLAGLIAFRRKKVRGEDIIDLQANNLISFLKEKKTYKPFISNY